MFDRDDFDAFKSGTRAAVQGKLCAAAHHYVTSLETNNPYFRASHIPMHIAHATEWGSIFTRGAVSHVLEGVSHRAHFAGYGLCTMGIMASVYKGLYDTASRFVHRNPLTPPRLYEVPKYDHWKAKSAVEMEVRKNYGTFYDAYLRASSRLGYPGNFDYSTFKSLVQSTGLVSSYNSINPSDKIAAARGYRGEIGGVATKVATLKGLKNSPDQVLFDDVILCVETADGKMPFSNAEFKQLVRELAQGIYIHNTYPFFSLHFNDDGCLYPVIHPAYQNTLVGKVIGLLDYYMKCYLNGGYFAEDFLDTWHREQKTDRGFLKTHLKDLKKYCKEAKLTYTSLREYTCKAGLEAKAETKNPFSVRNNKFRTSFRIIAEQKDVKKHNNIFIIDPDFNVEYTVDLAPDYKEYLEKYKKEHGEHPEDYQKLLQLYALMAQDIKENMPKIPFCRDAFQMLGVISFLCYYLTTLKEMDQVPVLSASTLAHDFHFPKALPPIPVRHYQFHPIKLSIKEVFKKLNENNKMSLNQWLLAVFENPSQELNSVLRTSLEKTLKTIILAQIPPNADKESDDFIHQFENGLVDSFIKYTKRNLAELNNEFRKQLIEIKDKAREIFNLDYKLEEKVTVIHQCNVLKQAIEKQFKEFKAGNIFKFTNKMQELLAGQNSEAEKAIELINQKIDEEAEEAIQKIAEQIDNNKKTELAKISKTLHGRPEVVAFLRKLEETKKKKKVEIEQKIESLKQTELAEIKERLEFNKIKIKEEFEKRKQEFIVNSEEIKNKVIGSLDEFLKIIDDIGVRVFIDQDEAEVHTFNHPCSILEIADAGFYQEHGDNVRIVGGCSVTLPNLQPSVIALESPLRSSLLPTLQKINDENLSVVTHDNKAYAVFKFKIQHRSAYSLLDYPELVTTLTSPEKKRQQQNTFGSNEIQYLTQAIESDAKDLKGKFDPRAKDAAGQTIVHYAISLNTQPKMLDAIMAEDKLSHQILLEVDKFGNLPIHTAASSGNTDAVSYIIDKVPVSLNAKNQQGLTPLLLAAQAGHKSVVEKLLSLNADVNYRLPNGLFALYLAIQNNYQDLALLLIAKTNVNFFLDSGVTCLHLSTDGEMDAISLALIKAGANVNHKRRADDYTPFHNAVEKGSLDVCTAMLATGKIAIDAPLPSGERPLHLAAKNGQLEVAKLLLEAKRPADINLKDEKGETALMSAIHAGQITVAIYLAEQVKINLKNKEEQTASLLALTFHQPEVADVLFQRGEDPCLQDRQGKNAVYYLLQQGEYQRYKFISKEHKINPNLIFDGVSSLAIAAKQGHHLLADYLLESKADFQNKKEFWEQIHYAVKTDHLRFVKNWLKTTPEPGYKIKFGFEKNKTLLYIAAEQGSEACLYELLKLAKPKLISAAFNDRHLLYAAVASGKEKIIDSVLSYCDDANIVIDDDQNTAMHGAVRLGLIHVVEFLNRCGANIVQRNKHQLTPFHVAIMNDDEEMLTKLLELTPAEIIPSDLYIMAFDHGKSACLKRLTTVSVTEKNRALVRACRAGNIKRVQSLLTDNVIPQEHKAEGHPLLVAIEEKQYAIIELLLPLIHDATILNQSFALALKQNQLDVVRLFIDRKLISSSQLKNYYSSNKWSRAVISGTFVEVDYAKESLIKALENSDHVTFTKILQADFPINSLYFDFKGVKQPLFHCAFALKASWALSILVKHGADPQIKDEHDRNIMHKLNMFETKELEQELQLIDLHFKDHKKVLLEAKSNNITPIDRALKFNQMSAFNAHIKETSATYNNNGNTLLHSTVICENYLLVEQLLKEGADVNACNQQLYTPLMLAVINGNIKLVQLLLAYGANPDKLDTKQNSALHLAILGSQVEIAMLLLHSMSTLDISNRSGNTPFMLAAGIGLHSLVDIFIKRQVNVHSVNKEGQNAVHLAAQAGHDKMIEKLSTLDIAIDLLETSKTSPSYTPLHWAAHRGHLAAFKLLIKLGADPLQKDSGGYTAIERAVLSKNDEAIDHILQLPFVDNQQVITDLFYIAVQQDYISLLTRLLLSGLNINVLRDDGSNALHLAAKAGASKSVALLLEQGSKLELTNDGDSPLHAAASCGSVSIIKQLSDAACALDIQNKHGNTALHVACEKKKLAAVLQLLKSGADLSLANKDGLTAAQIALINNDWEIAKILMIMGDDFYRQQFLEVLPEHTRKKFASFEEQLKQMASYADESIDKISLAIRSKDAHALLLLCQMQLDDLKNDNYISYMTTAIIADNLEAIKILIQYNPDFIRQVDYQNYNALTLALKMRRDNIANYLIVAGADISQRVAEKNQIQIVIEAGDDEALYGLLRFGATLSITDMQSILENKQLTDSYCLADHDVDYKKIQNQGLSSETIQLLKNLVKNSCAAETKDIQPVLNYAHNLVQQLIAQNEIFLEPPKLLYSKKTALSMNRKALAEVSAMFKTQGYFAKEAKGEDRCYTPKQLRILFILKKWQETIAKPVGYNVQFDLDNHLSFFSITRRPVKIEINRERGCVIL